MALFALAFLLTLLGCGRTIGPDSDKDGLSDRQERLFGTDPHNPDSDGDGLLDGKDPEPLGKGPSLTLTRGRIFRLGDRRCVDLKARLLDGNLDPLQGKEVIFESDFGLLDPVVESEPGIYTTRLCVETSSVVAHVVATYDDPHDMYLMVSAKITIAFTVEGELPEPGINTGQYKDSGPIDGLLRVFALDADVIGSSPAPFEGAQVVVSAKGKTLVGFTSPDGFVEFEDKDLKGPVDVTVGAEGYRFITYLGVNAQNIAVPMVRLDPVKGKDDSRIGTIEGKVIGFFGEAEAYGIEAFPNRGSIFGCDDETEIPLAIVQVALRNVPLSSISMGNILEGTAGSDSLLSIVPSNMVVPYEDDEETWRFRLEGLPEGQYLLFALGGTSRCLPQSMENPYHLWFAPRAMAIERVQVRGGEVTTQDLLFRIDLRPLPGKTVDVYLGSFPPDWKTGKPLPNGLVFGVVDTGGEGYLFVAVDATCQWDGFQNPVRIRFPDPDSGPMKELGLTPNFLAVGLAGRESVLGADPPGITTAVMPEVKASEIVDFSVPEAWIEVPRILHPEPPKEVGLPLDTLSKEPFTGEVVWKAVEWPRQPDFYVLRINYMTSAPRNRFIEKPGDPRKGSVGGPESHCLWEIFVPKDRTSLTLPSFPQEAPVRPVLRNPVPNEDDEEAPQHYGPKTLELELNAYILGARGKAFDYNRDFAYLDVNVHALGVSQDTVLVEVP